MLALRKVHRDIRSLLHRLPEKSVYFRRLGSAFAMSTNLPIYDSDYWRAYEATGLQSEWDIHVESNPRRVLDALHIMSPGEPPNKWGDDFTVSPTPAEPRSLNLSDP